MSIAITLGLMWLGLNALMYVQQPAMTFYPSRDLVATPADWGLEFTEVQLPTEDGVQVHGWFVPHPGARRTLLFLHGNGGNISHRGDSLRLFHELGVNVLIIDYRGYGQSSGRPSEAGVYRDAAAAWRYLTETRGIPSGDIIIFGRSLGCAVAAQLAAQVQPAAVILESTFSSARDFAAQVFPVLSRLVLVRYQFDTVAQLQHIEAPLLVLHSKDDDIIPYRLGEKVYQAAREPKQFFVMQGDHNSGFLTSQPAYAQALQSFLDSVTAGRH